MSFSDSSFAQSCEAFILASSSPTFLADPAPTDSPWTTTTTEQPASDGAFGSLGFYEEGLNFLQDFSENFDLSYIDQLNMVDTEGIALGIADHVYDDHVSTELDFPPVLGTGNSGTLLSDPGMDLPMGFSTFEDYTEDENRILSSGQLTDGGVTYVEEEPEIVVDSGQPSQDHASPQTLEARITKLETKMEELQKWQASQTTRNLQITEFIREMLDALHRNGNASIVN
ncbi:hypothetical protein HZS61_001874 [Fusarium oxysporum f. sp. conglutinans]|uniref:Uncharacterized protein n=2 Tax=Fusarium oxysporum f. sp. conglutinans TaxID=100902 RepID=A0A8H6H5F1_FUSOX|nr:hypothetical protein FOXB_16201 [Fusarium oxysporum f. sp. conglutinans Fo5176]KAF6530562.1 hypothetical protein HZS61_001874 [Fusarium oxysporum f. sp. conglutinans]KAG6992559.1 hypothetical protein FocnCong_v017569 [Fusarium oxysporum f. sp. conglutinans]KAI8417490.1 hypothetical protein FOFC_00045 [Fusarium oxysporum]